MGRFHQPEKYLRAGTSAVKPVSGQSPAAVADPIPPPPAGKPVTNLPVRPVPVIREVDGVNPMAKLGSYATLLYVFGVFSLFEELAITFVGVKPYLTTIAGVIAAMAAIFAGGIGRVFQFRPANLLLGFALWLGICIPFSTWPGGSFDGVMNYYSKSIVILILLMMTTASWRQLKAVLYTMTSAVLLIALAVRPLLAQLNSAGDGRLTFLEGRLANPNDLATHMIVLLPFVIGMFFLSGRMSLMRPLALLLAGATLYTTLMTASRGAFLTLLALGLILFLTLPNAVHKMTLAVVAFLVFAVSAAVLPDSVMRRYLLIFAGDDVVPESLMESQSLASSESRKEIFKRSLEITLRNPLFGVGPGAFQIAENEEARGEGRRGTWLQTHNAYTQVSSETGLPGILLFAAAILTSLRISYRYHRKLRATPGFEQQAGMALVIFFALAGFAINIIFSSLAYTFYVPHLVGLLGSFVLTMDRDLAIHERAAAAR